MIASIALFVALGGAAVAAGLPKNSVGPKQLKKGAVTAAKIRKGAITAGKLAPKSVVAGKLGQNAVTPGNLGNGVVTTAKLAANAVIASTIKNGVITTNKLANAGVTTAKLADGAVTPSKISVPLGGTVSTLLSGQTLRGVFDIGGQSGGAQGQFADRWSQSFPIPLQNAPNASEANILKPGQTSASCPGIAGGNAATPQAAPGQLCVYITKELGYEDSNFDVDSVSRLGFGLDVLFSGEPEKDHYVKGFWAVTAP
ncbi:MAG: hypothetical protein ACOYD4_02745 [Solirubrobacterales bacterium]